MKVYIYAADIQHANMDTFHLKPATLVSIICPCLTFYEQKKMKILRALRASSPI